jgi:hypothetical protein
MVGGVQPLRAAEETFHINVNNLATGVQYLPFDLKSEYLKREEAISVLEKKLAESLEEARGAEKGSSQSRVAWDEVEEIEAAISHYRSKNAKLVGPKVDMDKVKEEMD